MGQSFWTAVWKCESKVFSLAIMLLELSINNQDAQFFSVRVLISARMLISALFIIVKL